MNPSPIEAARVADTSQAADAPHCDVLVVGASAGGLPAILALLRGLPAGWPVPVVLMQHLAPNSVLEPLLARAGYTVTTVDARTRLAAGRLHVCPPRSLVSLLPDGGFALAEAPNGALDGPIDQLFDSAARGFGARAIGVILSGMGHDGAAGAARLHGAGATVLAQSPGSAEYGDMPRAVIDAGVADLIVPLDDLGQVIGELAAGTARPHAHSEQQAVGRVFGHAGEVARIAADIDWSQTPLGFVLGWPDALKLALRTVVATPQPAAIWWGEDLCALYNDGWRALLAGSGLLTALGQRTARAGPDACPGLVSMAERALYQGESGVDADLALTIERHGLPEEVHATAACTPLRTLNGAVQGVQLALHDCTRQVVAARRLRTLGALATAADPHTACAPACAALASDPADLPFALVYRFDPQAQRAQLACAAGTHPGSALAPRAIGARARDGWPVAALLRARGEAGALAVDDLRRRFPALGQALDPPHGADPPRLAMMVPLRAGRHARPLGVFIAGIGPHPPLDDDYRAFLDLVGGQLGAALARRRSGSTGPGRLRT